MNIDRVNQHLDAHRDEHLSALMELVRIPSIANVADGSCERAAAWLADALTTLGVQTRVFATSGQPVVLGRRHVRDGAPTLLIYGHYDVQPPEPLAEWHSPPFEPVVRDGWLFGRGADDDKGQFFTYIMALEAFVRTNTPLDVNLTFLFEGDEEIGSPPLEAFLRDHKDDLACDAVFISDSRFFAAGHPSITYALRGVSHGEFTIIEANSDVHSGLYGGVLRNPLHTACDIVAALHDADGRVTVPGFYDNVDPLSTAEQQAWAQLPFDEREYAAELGVTHLGGGEKGFSILERNWARPCLDVNGLFGGHTGPGAKTVIPRRATVKFSYRVVSRQDPKSIMAAMKKFVTDRVPPGMRVTFEAGSMNPAVTLAQDSPAMQAARDALRDVFGKQPSMIRCGASVPVTEMFQRMLGRDAVMIGFGLPEDRLHAPNEKFCLEQLYKGAKTVAAMWAKLAT
jgi:acetylornithine deacetylase/succinyl-diaminopimelate desuccinylase-like protein